MNLIKLLEGEFQLLEENKLTERKLYKTLSKNIDENIMQKICLKN